MSDSLIIIPTYNEKENIEKIIRKIFSLEKSFHILIVDDGSPDGTGKLVEEFIEKNMPQISYNKKIVVRLITRKKKEGGIDKAYFKSTIFFVFRNCLACIVYRCCIYYKKTSIDINIRFFFGIIKVTNFIIVNFKYSIPSFGSDCS